VNERVLPSRRQPLKGPSRPCRKAGCGCLCKDGTGYCDAHKALAIGWTRTTTTSRHERGYGTAWTVARKQAMRRDKALCQPCKSLGRYIPASEVDHIVPKSQGGGDELSNLQCICNACHKVKTGKEGGRGA